MSRSAMSADSSSVARAAVSYCSRVKTFTTSGTFCLAQNRSSSVGVGTRVRSTFTRRRSRLSVRSLAGAMGQPRRRAKARNEPTTASRWFQVRGLVAPHRSVMAASSSSAVMVASGRSAPRRVASRLRYLPYSRRVASARSAWVRKASTAPAIVRVGAGLCPWSGTTAAGLCGIRGSPWSSPRKTCVLRRLAAERAVQLTVAGHPASSRKTVYFPRATAGSVELTTRTTLHSSRASGIGAEPSSGGLLMALPSFPPRSSAP